MYFAEGSDWFWYFGADQDSGQDFAFDEMFRSHLRNVYRAIMSTRQDSWTCP
jgi:alpha-amylase/alpha-mannosidase (GH57 family)